MRRSLTDHADGIKFLWQVGTLPTHYTGSHPEGQQSRSHSRERNEHNAIICILQNIPMCYWRTQQLYLAVNHFCWSEILRNTLFISRGFIRLDNYKLHIHCSSLQLWYSTHSNEPVVRNITANGSTALVGLGLLIFEVRDHTQTQWRTEGGSTPSPSPEIRRLSKIMLNATRLWKLLKIAEFRTPTLQDVRKKGSKILKLPRFATVLH